MKICYSYEAKVYHDCLDFVQTEGSRLSSFITGDEKLTFMTRDYRLFSLLKCFP